MSRREKKTLYQRATDYARTNVWTLPYAAAGLGWLAGYQAAQRDFRRKPKARRK